MEHRAAKRNDDLVIYKRDEELGTVSDGHWLVARSPE